MLTIEYECGHKEWLIDPDEQYQLTDRCPFHAHCRVSELRRWGTEPAKVELAHADGAV